MLFERQHFPNLLLWPLVTAGAGALAFSLLNLAAAPPDARFLLFALITLSLGTRLAVKVPRARAYFSLADSLCVLALFVFDAGGAVAFAALASFCAALRLTRDARSLLLSASLGASSLLLAQWLLGAAFGSAPASLAQSSSVGTFALALCLVGAVYAALSAGVRRLAGAGGKGRGAKGEAVRGSDHFARDFCWTFVTALALVSFAGVLALTVLEFGHAPVLAALTAATVAHFAHGVYQRGRESSAPRAARGEDVRERAAASEGGEIFKSAFEHAAIGMGLVSPKGAWLRVNQSLCEILGYTEGELLAKGFQDVMHSDDLAQVLAHLKDLLKNPKQGAYRTERRFVHKRGHDVWALVSVARFAPGGRRNAHLIFQVQDITERRLSEEQLLHNAFHDALTGLPNRALFTDHVKLTIARNKRREGHLFAVLFLDLDRFKVINDSLGHMIGDQLLVGIARRLEACLREGDTVARVGGDEFTILLEDIADETEAVSVAERIQVELAQPFHLDGHEVFTTVSIGIAPSSTGYDAPEDILRDADTAMYRAKSLGKARHEVFDKAMHAIAVNLLQLETDLRKALERRELFVLYQPIVALDDFRLCGFEALVRWQHPERGLISPMDFIPVAEDTGQIIAIGEWMLHEACRQMRRWQKLFPSDSPLFISVNLSGRQFAEPNLIEQVRSNLLRTKLDPRCLKLEITESIVMENIETATEMLRQLRDLGVQLAIDDFGTGYSSLSYLHRFPIDTLKIDRSFVTRMVDNSENIEIVRTIILLAQTLGMDVVAEGVETKEQLALLRKLGCENGQGYYFSRPTPAVDAEKIIADTCARPAAQHAGASRPVPPPDDKVKTFRMVTPS